MLTRDHAAPAERLRRCFILRRHAVDISIDAAFRPITPD